MSNTAKNLLVSRPWEIASSLPSRKGVAELDYIETQAQELHDDLTAISKEISFDLKNDIHKTTIVDFDVIKSSIEWFVDSSREEFWSAVFLFLSHEDYFLLPGTLYEVRNYVTKRKRQEKRAQNSPFAKLFEDQSIENLFNEGQLRSEFTSSLSSFKNSRLTSADLYLLTVVKKKIDHFFSNNEFQLPPVSPNVFHWCLDQLSVGQRLGKWRNNRVDALNYSLLLSLNADVENTGMRYSFVTNTRAISRLESSVISSFGNNYLQRNFSDGFAQTPRRAAIYQLALRAGGGLQGAEKIAYELCSNLADFRYKLVKKREAGEVDETKNLEISDEFVGLLSLFDNFQKIVDYGTGQSRLSLLNENFNKNDPRKFYESLERNAAKVIKSDKYNWIFDSDEPSIGDMKLCLDAKSPFSEFGKAYKIRDAFADVAFCFSDGDGVCVYTFNNNSLEEFFSLLNVTLTSISRKLSLGQLPELENLEKTCVCVGTLDSPPKVFSGALLPSLDLLSVAKVADVAPNRIVFLRYDCVYFTISFEEDMLVFATSIPLEDEISNFLRNMTETRFRGKDFRSVVREFLNTCDL